MIKNNMDNEPNNDRENEPSDENKEAERDELAVSSVGTAENGAELSSPEIQVVLPTKKRGFRYGGYLFVKRAFDLVSAGLLFIVVSPIIAICLVIKVLEDIDKKYCKLEVKEVEDDGKKHKNWYKSKDGKLYECKVVKDPEKKIKGNRAPVYSSDRVGKGEKLFKFYKIRSMYPGAEAMKQQLIDLGLNEADEPAFKMKNDPRITPFGKFLRKSSIDELLQLLNIITSKMSVVGPRPPLPKEVEEYTPYQKHRLDVKGGLLCLWQIQHDRNKLTFDDWINLDLEYIEKQSVGLDLKIIFKGAYMVLFDRSGE